MPRTLRSSRQRHLLALLVEARRAAGLSQTEVARRLGKPQSFVAKYEGGERRLDIIEFLDIAAALEARPEALLATLLRGLAKDKATR